MAIYYKTKEEKDLFAQPHFVRFNHRFQGFRESYKINSDMSAFLFDVYKLYETLDRIDLSRDDQQIKILQGNDEMSFDGHTSPYASLPGTSGAYVSTPDNDAYTLTNLEIVARVRLVDWTPSPSPMIMSLFKADPNRNWRLYINGSGQMVFEYTPTGSAAGIRSRNSSVLGFTDNATYWVKVTLEDNVGGLNRTSFYWAADAPLEPTSWTAVGSSTTGASFGGFPNIVSTLELGSAENGVSNRLTGRIYFAALRNGVGGTTVAEFNPQRDWFPRVSTNVINSNTGELWTANGGASLVSNPTFTHEGSDELSARLASLKNRVFRLEQGF